MTASPTCHMVAAVAAAARPVMTVPAAVTTNATEQGIHPLAGPRGVSLTPTPTAMIHTRGKRRRAR